MEIIHVNFKKGKVIKQPTVQLLDNKGMIRIINNNGKTDYIKKEMLKPFVDNGYVVSVL